MRALLPLVLCAAAALAEDSGDSDHVFDLTSEHTGAGEAHADTHFADHPRGGGGGGDSSGGHGGRHSIGRHSGCKYWCKRTRDWPFGREKYYCCDDSGPDYWRPVPRPRHDDYYRREVCPPRRRVCTRRFFSSAALPTECYSDLECSRRKKCCYDTCLKHKVCKTVDYVELVRRSDDYDYYRDSPFDRD